MSGCIQDAVQLIISGQPLNTFEKQAPIWTFGVGGKPFAIGLGGVWRRRCDRFGGMGGVLLSRSGCDGSSKEQQKINNLACTS